jgi:hypothetical protein
VAARLPLLAWAEWPQLLRYAASWERGGRARVYTPRKPAINVYVFAVLKTRRYDVGDWYKTHRDTFHDYKHPNQVTSFALGLVCSHLACPRICLRFLLIFRFLLLLPWFLSSTESEGLNANLVS